MHLAVPRLLVRRSIMLLVSVALVAMTLIGLAGMSASFLVVDRSRASVQAIDVAGSLRSHTRRIAKRRERFHNRRRRRHRVSGIEAKPRRSRSERDSVVAGDQHVLAIRSR